MEKNNVKSFWKKVILFLAGVIAAIVAVFTIAGRLNSGNKKITEEFKRAAGNIDKRQRRVRDRKIGLIKERSRIERQRESVRRQRERLGSREDRIRRRQELVSESESLLQRLEHELKS